MSDNVEAIIFFIISVSIRLTVIYYRFSLKTILKTHMTFVDYDKHQF